MDRVAVNHRVLSTKFYTLCKQEAGFRLFFVFSLLQSVIGCISLVTGGKRFMRLEINEGARIHWILNLRIDFSRAIDIG